MMFDEFETYCANLSSGVVSSTAGIPSEATVRKRERVLEEFTHWVRDQRGVDRCPDIERGDLLAYVDHLIDQGYAENTITNSKWSSISAAFNHLHERQRIETNPVGRLTRATVTSKIEQSLTTAEKKRRNDGGPKDHLTKDEVYELAENHVPDPTDRNELLVKLLFWTGVRISEALSIEIGRDGTLDGPDSDISPTVPKIRVYRQKTGSTDTVSYPREELNPLLRDWVRNGRLRYKSATDTQALFVGAKGDLTQSRAVDIVREAAEKMGIQTSKTEAVDGRTYNRVTPHLLRHSHAMHQHNVEGVSLDAIKEHLGHSKVETTEQFYTEGTEEKIIDVFGE